MSVKNVFESIQEDISIEHKLLLEYRSIEHMQSLSMFLFNGLQHTFSYTCSHSDFL